MPGKLYKYETVIYVPEMDLEDKEKCYSEQLENLLLAQYRDLGLEDINKISDLPSGWIASHFPWGSTKRSIRDILDANKKTKDCLTNKVVEIDGKKYQLTEVKND